MIRSSFLHVFRLILISIIFSFPAGCLDETGILESSDQYVISDTARSILPDSWGINRVRLTNKGLVRGVEWDADTNAWLGIPYAAAPVGDLRWKAPRDHLPWLSVRDADTFCSDCVQKAGMLLDMDYEKYGQPVGSEDCLYLNVWRPKNSEKKLPVYFFIHGGLNSVGSSKMTLYHGANLSAQGNMVVVTLNYRLGPFGWFSHKAMETGDALDDSGNYGILDIIKALQWVKTNITAFGGDAGNVTIAGESAGGFNVISLLGSPLAKGLFHRAIVQSAASYDAASDFKAARAVAHEILIKLMLKDKLALNVLGAELVLAFKGAAWSAKYLRSKDPYDIIQQLATVDVIGLNGIGLLLESALAGSRFSDGTVIPDDFKKIFARGEYNKVPVIIGSNSEEARIFEFAMGMYSGLDEREVCRLFRDFNPEDPGFGLNDIIPPVWQPLYSLIGNQGGDLIWKQQTVDPLSTAISAHQDIYTYYFTWNNLPAPMDFLTGASHMMEIPFMLGNFQDDPDSMCRIAWSNANREECRDLSKAMISYISSFARTGNPNSLSTGFPAWDAWKNGKDELKRLKLDSVIEMVK